MCVCVCVCDLSTSLTHFIYEGSVLFNDTLRHAFVVGASSGLDQPFRPRKKSGFEEGREQGYRYDIRAEGALPPSLDKP